MSTVSRCSFLTGLAALASAATVGIAGFSASTAQAAEASGPSGTYTATAKGFAGDVTVTATFENGTLTDRAQFLAWTWSPFYMVNPRASPPSRVSVRRPSCSLTSARGACALGIPLLRLGPSSSSESVVVPAGPAPARRKKSGNGPQRPRTRRPGDRRPPGDAAGR